MKYRVHNHRNSDVIVSQPHLANEYSELLGVIESITEEEIISNYQERKSKEVKKGLNTTGKNTTKSLSRSINDLIRDGLLNCNWNSETAIFYDKKYTTKKWRLDFTKNKICVEVAFNHREAIPHNILKPVLSTEQNQLKKEFEAELGVVITATKALKKNGNFDNPVGTYEDFIEYFTPYSFFIRNPLIIIGLEALDGFYIDSKTKMPKKV